MQLLRGWLAGRLGAEPLAWLDQQTARIAAAATPSALQIGVGQTARRLGKNPLQPTQEEMVTGIAVCPGLDPSAWSIDQAGRLLLVLASFAAAPDSFASRVDALFRSGEIGEQIALLRGLPLYPEPQMFLGMAGEGVRSAMQPLFEAVAHHNPFPAEQFSEPMWNQMVVKALFTGSTLAPIQGLDARRNADLARMMTDYAHERWAAGRSVSPELWRCVGPYAEGIRFDDLLKVFASPVRIEQHAAALALAECPLPDALVALETAPELLRDIRAGRLTWNTLA